VHFECVSVNDAGLPCEIVCQNAALF